MFDVIMGNELKHECGMVEDKHGWKK